MGSKPQFRVRYRIGGLDLLTDLLSYVDASLLEAKIRANCRAELTAGVQRLSVVVDSETWRNVAALSPPFALTMAAVPFPLEIQLLNVTAAAQAEEDRHAARDREIERRASRQRRRALAAAIARRLGRGLHQAAAAVRAIGATVRLICS